MNGCGEADRKLESQEVLLGGDCCVMGVFLYSFHYLKIATRDCFLLTGNIRSLGLVNMWPEPQLYSSLFIFFYLYLAADIILSSTSCCFDLAGSCAFFGGGEPFKQIFCRAVMRSQLFHEHFTAVNARSLER